MQLSKGMLLPYLYTNTLISFTEKQNQILKCKYAAFLVSIHNTKYPQSDKKKKTQIEKRVLKGNN